MLSKIPNASINATRNSTILLQLYNYNYKTIVIRLSDLLRTSLKARMSIMK